MRKVALSVLGCGVRSLIPGEARARCVLGAARAGQGPSRSRLVGWRDGAGIDSAARGSARSASLVSGRLRLARGMSTARSRGEARAAGERATPHAGSGGAVPVTGSEPQSDEAAAAERAAAAAASARDQLDSIRAPPVDWSQAQDMEATSTSGRVRSSATLSATSQGTCLSEPLHCRRNKAQQLCQPLLGSCRLRHQVVIAQANFMRVLVNMKDMTKLQRETRMAQLEASFRTHAILFIQGSVPKRRG